MASHVLPEIEQIANRVMILLNGRLLTTDALAQAVDDQRLRLHVAGPEATYITGASLTVDGGTNA